MSIGWIVAIMLYALGFVMTLKITGLVGVHEGRPGLRFCGSLVWPLGVVWAMVAP